MTATSAGAVDAYFDLLNEGDVTLADQIFAPDGQFRITTIPVPLQGPEGLKGFVSTLRTGFPDIHFEPEHRISTDDKVLVRWSLKGTHEGEFLGIPPTGRVLEDRGNDIFHLRDGLITRIWINEDSLGLMRQLGAIPGEMPPHPEVPPSSPDGAGSSPAANIEVMRRYFEEAMNDYDLDVVDEIVHDEFLLTIPTHGPARGPEGFKQEVTMLHTAFPDLHFSQEDVFAEGNRVAVRWVARGTHLGEFLGNAPSGRRFWIDGIGSYRFLDGKLVESAVNEDSLNLLIQIGVIPPPSASHA